MSASRKTLKPTMLGSENVKRKCVKRCVGQMKPRELSKRQLYINGGSHPGLLAPDEHKDRQDLTRVGKRAARSQPSDKLESAFSPTDVR